MYCSLTEIPLLSNMGIKAEGFSMKNLKKWYERNVLLWDYTVFFKLWAWEQCDYREWTFHLTKYGNESSWFSVKYRKNMASYWRFEPKIYCSFDRIYVFLTKYGLYSREFFIKNFTKNIIRPQYFLYNGHFFDKIWVWDHCVF